jgi:hypothetical protein
VSSSEMTPVTQGVPSLVTDMGFPSTAVVMLHTQKDGGEFYLIHDTAAISGGTLATDYGKLPNGSMVYSDADHKMYVKEGTVGLLNGGAGKSVTFS